MPEHEKQQAVRRILALPDLEQLKKDLVFLKDKAYAAGASDVVLAPPADVLFFPGQAPGQEGSKQHVSAHWPVSYPKDSIKDAIRAFEHGVFFRARASGVHRDCGQGPILDPAHRELYQKTYEIVAAVESAAFYMGHHLVLGFACGNCRAVFCHDKKHCHALVKGRVCVYPYKARPSLLALGIDALSMAKNAGWSVSPESLDPLITGLVMIA